MPVDLNSDSEDDAESADSAGYHGVPVVLASLAPPPRLASALSVPDSPPPPPSPPSPPSVLPPRIIAAAAPPAAAALQAAAAPPTAAAPLAAAAPPCVEPPLPCAPPQGTAAPSSSAPARRTKLAFYPIVHPSLLARYGELSELPQPPATISGAHRLELPLTVGWVSFADGASGAPSAASAAIGAVSSGPAVGERAPRIAIVWEVAQLVRLGASGGGALMGEVHRAQMAARAWAGGGSLHLVAAGRSAPGLDGVIDALQLEAGVSVRRVLNGRELVTLLDSYANALTDGARHPACTEGFLAGLTAHDVLRNKGVPRSLAQSWLGALRQVVPESAATAIYAEYPSFRRLYERLRQADANEGTGASASTAGSHVACLADLRVAGGKRLGPARARRLQRVLMAAREQAFETV